MLLKGLGQTLIKKQCQTNLRVINIGYVFNLHLTK